MRATRILRRVHARMGLLAAVGARIRELREARGETQAEVAERLGMTLTNYQRIEYGKQNLTLLTMERLATALEAPVISLLARARSKRHGPGRPRPLAKPLTRLR